MPDKMTFTTAEKEKLGILVNNFTIYAAQIVGQSGPDFAVRALSNLIKVKKENDELIKRLDELARQHNDESPLRLIQDLGRVPTDISHMMTLVRRCLLASAFLGHCIAQSTHEGEVVSDLVPKVTRLH